MLEAISTWETIALGLMDTAICCEVTVNGLVVIIRNRTGVVRDCKYMHNNLIAIRMCFKDICFRGTNPQNWNFEFRKR